MQEQLKQNIETSQKTNQNKLIISVTILLFIVTCIFIFGYYKSNNLSKKNSIKLGSSQNTTLTSSNPDKEANTVTNNNNNNNESISVNNINTINKSHKIIVLTFIDKNQRIATKAQKKSLQNLKDIQDITKQNIKIAEKNPTTAQDTQVNQQLKPEQSEYNNFSYSQGKIIKIKFINRLSQQLKEQSHQSKQIIENKLKKQFKKIITKTTGEISIVKNTHSILQDSDFKAT